MLVGSEVEDTTDCVLTGSLDGDTVDIDGIGCELGIAFSLVPEESDVFTPNS